MFAPPTSPAAVTAAPRVLVVEDDHDTRALTGVILRKSCRVIGVSDAATALSIATEQPFDVFVLDIHLGQDSNGIDLLRRLRHLPSHRHTPAIAITAFARPEDRPFFLKAGFDHYLSKPFTQQALRGAVREAVGAVGLAAARRDRHVPGAPAYTALPCPPASR